MLGLAPAGLKLLNRTAISEPEAQRKDCERQQGDTVSDAREH